MSRIAHARQSIKEKNFEDGRKWDRFTCKPPPVQSADNSHCYWDGWTFYINISLPNKSKSEHLSYWGKQERLWSSRAQKCKGESHKNIKNSCMCAYIFLCVCVCVRLALTCMYVCVRVYVCMYVCIQWWATTLWPVIGEVTRPHINPPNAFTKNNQKKKKPNKPVTTRLDPVKRKLKS